MLDLFKKKTISQKRKVLRKKIRKLEKKSAGNPRTSYKLGTLRNKYQQLGIDLVLATPFEGLDTTGASIVNEKGENVSIHQLGPYLGEDSPDELVKAELATTPVYLDGVRSEVPVEPGTEIKDPGDYEEIEGYE